MRLSVPFNRNLPPFLSVAVKHFTRSDGLINYEEVSIKYYECVSLPCRSYPAAKFIFFCAEFDCYAWPAWPNDIFPLYLKKAQFSLIKSFVHKMCVLISYTTFVRNISHSKKYSVSYNHKYTSVFM